MTSASEAVARTLTGASVMRSPRLVRRFGDGELLEGHPANVYTFRIHNVDGEDSPIALPAEEVRGLPTPRARSPSSAPEDP